MSPLSRQAYLALLPDLPMHLVLMNHLQTEPAEFLPSICLLSENQCLFKTQFLCTTFSEVLIPCPVLAPIPHSRAELASLQCLHSASMENSRILLVCHLFPSLSSAVAVSLRADTVTYIQRDAHIYMYIHNTHMSVVFSFY